MSGHDLESTALAIGTNARLATSIYGNLPDSMAPLQKVIVTAGAMEAIREELAIAHMDSLEGGTPEAPVQLSRSEIREFHEVVFQRNGASPGAFGGATFDSLGTAVLGDNAAGDWLNGALRSNYDGAKPRVVHDENGPSCCFRRRSKRLLGCARNSA